MKKQGMLPNDGIADERALKSITRSTQAGGGRSGGKGVSRAWPTERHTLVKGKTGQEPLKPGAGHARVIHLTSGGSLLLRLRDRDFVGEIIDLLDFSFQARTDGTAVSLAASKLIFRYARDASMARF